MLKQNHIPDGVIKGTGKSGRITKEDVIMYLRNKDSPQQATQSTSSHDKPINVNNQDKVSNVIKKYQNYLLEDQAIVISGYKKGMTKTMTKNTEIPQFLYTDEYNVDKLIKARTEANKLNSGVKLSYLPFIIKAVSLSLKEFPILNSITTDKRDGEGLITEYIMKKDHNISVAIDGPEGLVVPNIKSVQTKSIIGIHKELEILRERSKNLRLTPADLSGGTFSISNIGNIGGKGLNPCILPPQVAIMAVSKMYDSLKLVPKSDLVDYENYLALEGNNQMGVAYHKVINMCISGDHRVVDGATVARFSELLRSYIENPIKMWLDDC